MKVTKLGVLATAGPGNGGTYQYTLSMLDALRYADGVAVTLYGDPQNPDFKELGFPIVGFREPYARQVRALAADQLHIALADPFAGEDVLLAPIYSLALLHTSRPFAYTLHDLQQLYYPQNFSSFQCLWRHQIYTRVSARAARIVCESEYVKADIHRFYHIAAERIVVMPAPPQGAFLSLPSDQQVEEARRRLNLPQRFLFYPAHFWHHKNHLRLIEAFREVAPEVSDLGLVLTGKEQEGYAAAMGAVDAAGLREKVVHLGYVTQDDIRAIYRLATALVMPSLFESISIPIYEAFQAGTPVAASNILAIPEQVGDGGLLFDPHSAQSIKAAIFEIIRDPAAAQARAGRARARMAAMTPQSYGAQLAELVAGMAASRVAANGSSR
jgi:glycosyltransferase involved in cell wall biosynthesis